MRQEHEFEWDEAKNSLNQARHGVSFDEARQAFDDPRRIVAIDKSHGSDEEERLYCIGQIGRGILMERFTYRGNRIRIFGAGFWRQGRRVYEERYG
jgi:uncharacterized DUF497 family protein